jgi:hypothetical protein
MKHFTIILLVLISSCKRIDRFEQLPNFRIIHHEGCEAIGTWIIEINSIQGKFYAYNKYPLLYYGNNTDSIWITELDSAKIQLCRNFLIKASSLPNNCPNLSTSMIEDSIILPDRRLSIKGHCDWDSLSFFRFQERLFKDDFNKLQNKRDSLTKRIKECLHGCWYFKPLKTIKRDDIICLNKVDSLSDKKYCWFFGNDSIFKSKYNVTLDFSYSSDYKLNVDNKEIFLEINAGFLSNDKVMTVENDGATFILDSISQNTIKLRYLWR